jgi:hypothetical protein
MTRNRLERIAKTGYAKVAEWNLREGTSPQNRWSTSLHHPPTLEYSSLASPFDSTNLEGPRDKPRRMN